MAEVIKRGEVYWLHSGNATSSVEQMRRPIVVVSSDKGNESNNPTLIGIPLTTKPRWGVINPMISTGGEKASYAMCNQIQTYDKVNVGDYIGTLSEYDMAAVEKGIRFALSLGFSESEDDEEEKRELEEEIESLRTKLKSRDDDELGVIVERDMWKKMYEKVLDELASLRVAREAREAKPVPVYEAKAEEPKKVDKPKIEEEPAKLVEEKLVEINTCTESELRNIGCTLTMIHNIIEKRPYKAVTDLKVVPGITRVAYQIIEKKVCCVPVKKPAKVEPVKVAEKVVEVTAEKVNVNTATVEEMMRVAGLGKGLAEHIRAHRNKRGKFETLEDLLKVDIFGPKCMVKYGGKLTV